ncbi:MAG TPA: hypothetical protein VNW99_09990 [Cytophagaceae bacterium]|jgi:putative transposase|nr:hypothetical protein [Cytophagaceae bacterium]
MQYNPLIHHRRSIRLKGYDYSQADSYFITICCQDRKCRFGKITVVGASLADAQNAQMELNEYGMIAYNEWMKLPQRFPIFELDVFQIMPNHMHGIITLVRTSLTDAHDIVQPHNENRAGVNHAPTIGDIVGAYKSLVANACLEIYKSKNAVETGFTPVPVMRAGVNPTPTTTPMMGKLWQRNYYEHITRNEQSYQNISNYIISNPAKWNEDKFYSI